MLASTRTPGHRHRPRQPAEKMPRLRKGFAMREDAEPSVGSFCQSLPRSRLGFLWPRRAEESGKDDPTPRRTGAVR